MYIKHFFVDTGTIEFVPPGGTKSKCFFGSVRQNIFMCGFLQQKIDKFK